MNEPLNPALRQRVRVPPPQFCECGDPGCPVCQGRCRKPARTTVYRSDMEDETGTPMCEGCAADCMDSGVFYTKESIGYRVVDALINEEGLAAADIIEALKPPSKVKGVSRWEKKAGRKVEAEHATDNKTRDTISSQHHAERKDYYRRLEKSGLAPELGEASQPAVLKRPFWGHPAGKHGRYTPGHPPSPVNKYTGKLRLKGSPPASVSDEDANDLYSIEPLKEPPGSPADLKLKAPPPQASFYPSNGGPSSV